MLGSQTGRRMASENGYEAALEAVSRREALMLEFDVSVHPPHPSMGDSVLIPAPEIKIAVRGGGAAPQDIWGRIKIAVKNSWLLSPTLVFTHSLLISYLVSQVNLPFQANNPRCSGARWWQIYSSLWE